MSSHEKIYVLNDEDAMRDFGKRLAQSLGHRPMLVFISGELGAGKTTLVQGFIKALLKNDTCVNSPTYAYLETYESSVPIFHFDLYRIEEAQAVHELGLTEFLDDTRAIRLIEWPERLDSIVTRPDIKIHISLSGSGRKVSVKYFTPFQIIP